MQSLRLRNIFSSHMVLQRNRPIVLSGFGEPGRAVGVTFAGRSERTAVGADGQWSVTFPGMNAGGPHTLAAWYDGEEPSVRMDDILVGEVWMCTGQSNMEMPVHSDNPFWRTANSAEEAAHASHPAIRLFNSFTTRRLAPDAPLDDESPDNPGWLVCSPATVADFSACAYFFGRQLHDDLDIPIGLISTAWGGTRIEAWISQDKFDASDWTVSRRPAADIIPAWLEALNSDALASFRDWLTRFDALGATPPEWLRPDFDDHAWTAATGRSIPLPSIGRTLCRIHLDLPHTPPQGCVTLHLGIVNDADQTAVNGVHVGATTPETPNYWAAQRTYTIPAGTLVQGHNVITVQADNHYATGDVNLAGLALADQDGNPIDATLADIRLATVFTAPTDFPCRPNPPCSAGDALPDSPNYPSTLFNSLISPWLKTAIRGTIWYQGCSNAGQFSYFPLHQMLIDDFREQWHDPRQPFLIVQLAAFDRHTPEQPADPADYDHRPFPEFSAYALTREIQQVVAETMDNVGLITAFDCGDPTDIHPRDKQTLGRRLALKAEDMLNWIPRDDADSPAYAGHIVQGDTIRLFFTHAEGGLHTTDGLPPKSFFLGLPSGELVPANARIDGDTILLSSPLTTNPQRVRYAFTGFCRVNLVNRHGLPVLPFRTDTVDYNRLF